MTKEVIVSLQGLQNVEQEEGEPIETISSGTYAWEEGRHLVQYEEVDEEDQEITNVTLVFEENHVEIIKQGMSNVQMVFDTMQKTTSCYKTPYGDLMVGIDTTDISIKEVDDVIDVVLKYTLDMNYNHVADCKVAIKIAAKELEE